MTCVVEADGRLAGIITDGDLRRHMTDSSQILERTAGEVMTPHPVTIGTTRLVAEALKVMEERKITSLIVVEHDRARGVLHLHDLWRTDLI
jgi:arabinose-5-phosphate isomerase